MDAVADPDPSSSGSPSTSGLNGRGTDLSGLVQARRYVELSAKMLTAEVVKVRGGGATWQQIGDVIGISHQGARQRYARFCGQALASAPAQEAVSANGHSDAAGLTWPSPLASSPS